MTDDHASRCPNCASPLSTCIDSRHHHDLGRRRIRRCSACRHTWRTIEVRAELLDTLVGFVGYLVPPDLAPREPRD